MTTDARGDSYADLQARIDAIESAYEFMLAYAAQGRSTDRGAAPDRSVRTYLTRMETALAGLGAVAAAAADARDTALREGSAAFFEALERDAAIAHAATRLLLARDDISSQLVDNLNASIHLRALLTDVFVLDEALKTRRGES
jgi:hypothetical protein